MKNFHSMKEYSSRLKDADKDIAYSSIIKTENLYNERRRERLLGVSLKFELEKMKYEVLA